MPTIEFAIDLTVPDNTAFTVLTALRDLGYDKLERVERTELLRLAFSDAAPDAAECARALTRAEVVFNPNKHRLGYDGGAKAAGSEAVVADKDDDNSALAELLSTRFGLPGLERLERATAWRLFENGAQAAPAEKLDWACRVLLANAHSQTYEIRTQPAYVSVTA